MSTYLSPVPSNATWYPPTPSTTFSHSRSQTSSRSEPVHLPLPRADYPLLHSLLDSPEYRQAMNRYPELNRSPAPPPSKSSKRTPSTTRSSSLRRPSKTPSTTVSDVWSRKPTNSSNLSSSTLAASTRGGSRIASSLQAIHSPSDHSQLRSPIVPGLSPRSSSPQPWSNFAPLPPTSTATTAPLPLVNPVQRSASTSMRLPGSVASSVVRRNGQDSFDRTPLSPLSNLSPTTQRPHSASRSLPDLPRPPLPSRSFTAPSYPVRRPRDSTISIDSSFVEVKSPSSFFNAISHLKRMLTRKNSQRTRSFSKGSSEGASTTVESRSRSTSVFSSYVGGDGIEELVISPTTYGPSSASPSAPSPSAIPSSFPSSLNKSSSSSNSQGKPGTTKLLKPRAPVDSTLQNYVDSRKALLQLLRDGPGADVARSSPVLQATIGNAHSEKSIRTRGKFAWLTKLGRTRSQSRRRIQGEGERERKEDRAAQVNDLRRKKSVATIRSRKSSGRPHSLFGRKLSRSRSEISLGFVDLAPSKSLDAQIRSTTAYSSYGERWENDWRQRGKKSGEVKAEEDRKVWKKWRTWVRERREGLS